ncbi:MAG: hypothetical protein IJV27_02205 [Prevotella sp.]|nr:hypothetical protein [Prevotella sp.]
MKQNSALSADVRGSETGADAAPTGKRKYVPPTTQVIPLDTQAPLVTSGQQPPVFVTVYGVVPWAYYYHYGWGAYCMYEDGYIASCDPNDLARGFIGGPDCDVVFSEDLGWDPEEFLQDAVLDECIFIKSVIEGDGTDGCYNEATFNLYDFSGTYKGRRFVGTMDFPD